MYNKIEKENKKKRSSREKIRKEEAEAARKPITGETEWRLKTLEYVMLGAIIILVVGFITMFVALGTLIWNAHIWSGDIYREFIDKLDNYNNLKCK